MSRAREEARGGRSAQAAVLLQAFVDARRGELGAELKLALLYKRLGRPGAQSTTLLRAATLLAKRGDIAVAIAFFDRAMRVDPDQIRVRRVRAWALVVGAAAADRLAAVASLMASRGERERGCRLLELALRIEPNTARMDQLRVLRSAPAVGRRSPTRQRLVSTTPAHACGSRSRVPPPPRFGGVARQ